MIRMFYSPSRKGFFQSDVNKSIPTDAIEITQEEKVALLDGESDGKVISVIDGVVTLTDPILAYDQIVAIERAWRNSELSKSDIELNKVQDSDPKAKGSVSDWRAYRKALRAWPENAYFPDVNHRPISPYN